MTCNVDPQSLCCVLYVYVCCNDSLTRKAPTLDFLIQDDNFFPICIVFKSLCHSCSLHLSLRDRKVHSIFIEFSFFHFFFTPFVCTLPSLNPSTLHRFVSISLFFIRLSYNSFSISSFFLPIAICML